MNLLEEKNLVAKVERLRRDVDVLQIVVLIGIGGQAVAAAITVAFWLLR